MVCNEIEYNVFAKILVTGRGKHAPIKDNQDQNDGQCVNRIKRCDYWLKIDGFSDYDMNAYLSKINVKNDEICAIFGSHWSMKEILKNPLFSMLCASSIIPMNLLKLQSQERLFRIIESLMNNYKEYCKTKQCYNEEEYEESLNAVSNYAAYQLGFNSLECFKNYVPDMKIITKFGWVNCIKHKLSLTDMKMTYSFYHHTLMEYFAARFISIKKIQISDFSSLTLNYFIFSLCKGMFFQRCDSPYSLTPYCGLSVQEIYRTLKKPQTIKLDESWTLDQTNLIQFCEYFEEIIFDYCNFEKFEEEKTNEILIEAKNNLEIKRIEVRIINCKNVINLLLEINFMKPTKFKFLVVVVKFLNDGNDSIAINEIEEVSAFDFLMDEVFFDFVNLNSKEELIFCLIIVEKLLDLIRCCTLVFENFKERSFLNLLIEENDGRLSKISDKLGEHGFVIKFG